MTTPTIKPKTFIAKVLDYLKTGHSIDLPKALAIFGNFRLSATVMSLREKGFDIRTTEVKPLLGNVFSLYTLPTEIDLETRIGTRVRVKSVGDSMVNGRVGSITGVVKEDEEYPLSVLLDSNEARPQESLGFNAEELEPEYLNA